MRYFLISIEKETSTYVNSDGDDRYTYTDFVSVLTCKDAHDALVICANVGAKFIREII